MKRLWIVLSFITLAVSARASEAWKNPVADVLTGQLDKKISFMWAKDPFYRSPGSSLFQADAEPIVLQAIVREGKQAVAMINGVAVTENDFFQEKRVAQIGVDYVILEGRESLQELVFLESKKAAAGGNR